MNKRKNIVLIGMSGVGKTTVANYLSDKFAFELIDTDYEIKKKMDMGIDEIFARYGETYFRQMERQVIKDISKKKNQVISTGGGIILNEDNILDLKSNGIIYYLEADTNILYERLLNSEEIRPLLNGENPLGKLETLYKEREERYKKYADSIVNTDILTVESLALKLIKVHDKKILR